MDPALASTMAVLASETFGLAGLWLRLRSSIQHADLHHRLLVDLTDGLPPGGALLEQRPDGTRLAVITSSDVIH